MAYFLFVVLSLSIIDITLEIRTNYTLNSRVNNATCRNSCFRKCCDFDYILSNNVCIENISRNDFRVKTFDGKTAVDSYFKITTGVMFCEEGKYILNPEEGDQFYVQNDGVLWVSGTDEWVNPWEYCLDEIPSGNFVAIVCFPDQDSQREQHKLENYHFFKPLGIIISIPFLVATLLIYALIPEKTNINTRCQMCYVFSLICAYCILVSIQLTGNLEGALCTTLGLLCHYSFMTSFCWMNISCVDIFRTFSGQRGFGFSNRSSQMRRFFFYCLYTYGLPLVMVAIILGLNAYEHEGAWFHPNFGIGQCWLRRGYPLMLYFYGPMGILLLANIILFLLTALKIRQINKDTAMLRSDESKKHYESNKQRFNIYIKLIIVMGINWTLEFISWLVDWLMGDNKIPELWYVTDMCNALYGVFIFYLFVCKRKIWIMMKKRYYIFMGKPQKARALSSNANHFQFSQTNTEYLSSSSKM